MHNHHDVLTLPLPGAAARFRHTLLPMYHTITHTMMNNTCARRRRVNIVPNNRKHAHTQRPRAWRTTVETLVRTVCERRAPSYMPHTAPVRAGAAHLHVNDARRVPRSCPRSMEPHRRTTIARHLDERRDCRRGQSSTRRVCAAVDAAPHARTLVDGHPVHLRRHPRLERGNVAQQPRHNVGVLCARRTVTLAARPRRAPHAHPRRRHWTRQGQPQGQTASSGTVCHLHSPRAWTQRRRATALARAPVTAAVSRRRRRTMDCVCSRTAYPSANVTPVPLSIDRTMTNINHQHKLQGTSSSSRCTWDKAAIPPRPTSTSRR